MNRKQLQPLSVKKVSPRPPLEERPRARVLASAVTLFAEKGYAGTSVAEIVALAGVTKPVLYYHFQNKEGLFRFIMNEALDIQEEMLTGLLHSKGPLIERLAGLFEAVYSRALEKPHLFRMLHNLAFAPLEGGPRLPLETLHTRMVAALEALLVEGMEKGEVVPTDPKEGAYLVLGILGFCLDFDRFYPSMADAGRPARLLQLAFRGLGLKRD